MPFGIFRRDGNESPPPAAGTEATLERRGPRFEGLAESWRIDAEIAIEGRLSDILNRRDPILVYDVLSGPADGSAPLQAAPHVKTVDPYELIVAMAGSGGPPLLSDAELESYRQHRSAHAVVLDAAPYRVGGTVFLLPGTTPQLLLERAEELFIAVVEPVIHLRDSRLENVPTDVVLVNRSYLHAVGEGGEAPGA